MEAVDRISYNMNELGVRESSSVLDNVEDQIFKANIGNVNFEYLDEL